MRNFVSADIENSVAQFTVVDDGRMHLICLRPIGAFQAFDERLTRMALRFTRFLRVTILRSWDFAAQQDWVGFMSATVPTVLLVRAGQIVSKSVGDLPTIELEQLALEHMACVH